MRQSKKYEKKALSVEGFSALVAERNGFYSKQEIQDVIYLARDMLLDLMMEGEPVCIPKLGTFEPCVQGRNGIFHTSHRGTFEVKPRWGFKLVRNHVLRNEFHDQAVEVRKYLKMHTDPNTSHLRKANQKKDTDVDRVVE